MNCLRYTYCIYEGKIFLIMNYIKFSPPDITDAEIDSVCEALKSGWITTGPRTKLFEKRIAEYCNTSRAVCLSSATACMEMALRVLGIGEGDEVITSAYTYTASCSVICHVGAKPVLVDTGVNSFQMDYAALENAITDKTKAIIPVDLAGVMCDYDKIFEIIEKKKDLFKAKNSIQEKIGRVAILADAAHAFGASRNGEKCGSVADFTAFSFHAVKNLTTAEGGAVTWRDIDGVDNDYIYKQFMLLSLHGQSKDALEKSQKGNWEYDIMYPGFKCNMTDIMAAIGLAQLDRYNDILKKRRRIIEIYNEGLKNENVQVLTHYDDISKSSGHLYLVRLNEKDEAFRNNLIIKMEDCGIATNVHYKPLPMHTAYKNMGFDIKNYPNSFNMYKNEITLPLHNLLTEEEARYVVDSFKKCLNDR